MVDYTDPQRAGLRLSDRDRDEAVGQLAAARDEGRLSPAEFEERAASARAAVTGADLTPLFSDLPRASAAPTPPPPFPPAPPAQGGAGGRALGGAVGATIMALVPFLAVGLFFICGFYFDGWGWAWLWFLLIPIAGIVIYGPGSDYRRGR